MWYNLNAQNFLTQSISTFLRKSRLNSLLALAASELVDINNIFITNRNQSIIKVKHNSQVCKLRKILNDSFDYQRRIIVTEGVLKQRRYIYTDGEQKPMWLGQAFIYTDAETQGNEVDFIVIIPQELRNYQIEISSMIDFYKLASKRYKIVVNENI